MKKTAFVLCAALVCGLGIGASYTIAQTVLVPTVTNVGTADLFQDVVGGAPVAGNKYATAAQITNVPGYHFFGTISGDPAYTIPNGVSNLFAHAAGTISTVTLTLPAAPADGARECWWLDQTTTTLTWTANTGQTVGANVHAAGVQYNANCVTYQASTATWFSSP